MAVRRRTWGAEAAVNSSLRRLAQFLVTQFKFKYLSALDLIKFEEKTTSPESS